MKSLLTITAAVEAGTGVALAIAPSEVVRVLLGPPLDSPASLVIARVLAAAVFSLGAACWLSRNDGRGLVRAMLLYNVGAVVVLGHARIGLGMTGIGLLPAILLHTVRAAWCFATLGIGRRKVSPENSRHSVAP